VYFSTRTSSSTLYVSIGMCGASCACVLAWVFVRAFVCVRCSVHVCAGLCACARVCRYMRALECARSYGFAFVSASIFVCVCVQRCVCVCMARLCTSRLFSGPPVARRRPVVYSARPAARGRARVRVCARCHRPGSRAFAAGVNWASRTASAEWAGRCGHTSVIDAAGVIYVIGGVKDNPQPTVVYQDVWASTDGGEWPDFQSVRGWLGGTQVRLVPSAGFARVGHRCELGESYTRAAVGCAILPLDRDRRFRRHLRYRRRQPGCVGQHRQRCGPDSR
jgi:hypothetical protein